MKHSFKGKALEQLMESVNRKGIDYLVDRDWKNYHSVRKVLVRKGFLPFFNKYKEIHLSEQERREIAEKDLIDYLIGVRGEYIEFERDLIIGLIRNYPAIMESLENLEDYELILTQPEMAVLNKFL